MKNIILLLFPLISLFSAAEIFPQIPSYKLVAKNFDHPKFTGNYVMFDIYLIHIDTNRFEYAGGEYAFNYYTPVANGGNLVYEIPNFNQSDLPSYLRPSNPQVHVNQGDTSQLTLMPNLIPRPGGGYIIPQNTQGIRIMQLYYYTTVQFMLVRIDPPLGSHWIDIRQRWTDSTSLFPTKIYAYVNNLLTDITNPAMHSVDSAGLQIFPVELISFSHFANKNKVTLNWTTSSEINNSGFEIHRMNLNTADSGLWKILGFVNGYGTTNESKNYSFTDKVTAGKFSYRLKQIDYNGNFEYFYLTSDIEISVPDKFYISQNYPNPFNPSTKIDFQISLDGIANIKLYNNLGKFVCNLMNEFKPAGYYSVNVDMNGYAGGIYYYKFESGNFSEVRKMVFLK